ncbi:hypothetical protein BCR34DRAFT_484179 [Clohesyomyces aquaticus]|uniref:Nucleoside-diphosphate-sugar epimerase n=1 Tax=Clohesyomyces aquaticus TaxID=1231657 RepID=A0A1Y1ZMG7_9PLEO|nr:hypothetical protein BCR34DRAFT_484179 [Clohesyomyces aquaticus]
MLGMKEVTRISILSRRPVAMAEGHEDKAKVIIHKDFKQYDAALLEQFKDAHGCVWSLGISQNSVSKSEYIEITHDYTMAAAEAFSKLHPERPFTFVYVSGEGATQKPGMFTPLFGRVKGETETALIEFGKKNPNFKVYNVRPGGVDPTNHPEILPYIPAFSVFKKAFVPAFNAVWKGMMTPTAPLGKVLTELALSNGAPLEGKDIQGDGRIVPNLAIRRIAGI